jgi:uncharacterized protein YbjT (DUF2867 family)
VGEVAAIPLVKQRAGELQKNHWLPRPGGVRLDGCPQRRHPRDAGQCKPGRQFAPARTAEPHIVRLSEKAPEPISAIRSGRLHAEVNAELEACGLPYTSLRPCFYMQNTMLAAQSVASDGRVYMPFEEAKLVMIDMRDVIETATKVLTTEGHAGQTYVLTGPAQYSFHDVASGLSKALGKEVRYVNVPMPAAREAMIGVGMPEWVAEAYCKYIDNAK